VTWLGSGPIYSSIRTPKWVSAEAGASQTALALQRYPFVLNCGECLVQTYLL
jgi:hypothetical protein